MTPTDALATGHKGRKDLRLDHIEVVVNPASGGVDADAQADMQRILAEAGLPANVSVVQPDALETALEKAVKAKPDLLIVLAGDGTARAAAELCGADGPLLAPLAGGTMNMLPYAIYGKRPWQEALVDLLARGEIKRIGGGAVGPAGGAGEHYFYVAAILGAPALWAQAREAVRKKDLREAWERARYAYERAFCSRLRFRLDGGEEQSSEALTLLCPLISRAMSEDEDALEADALDPRGAAEAFRLGFRTLMSQFIGDWRQDPAVTARKCRKGVAWAGSRIPALLDGESVRLPRQAQIRWRPNAFRALAARPKDPAQTDA